MDSNAPIRFSDDSLEGRMQRFDQGLVDADIEGIPADPDGEALVRDMIARGLDSDTIHDRINAYLRNKKAHTLAAE